MVKNFDASFSRFDRIPACDGRTDGQTSCHGIVRAMHTRRAVKFIDNFFSNLATNKPTNQHQTMVTRQGNLSVFTNNAESPHRRTRHLS